MNNQFENEFKKLKHLDDNVEDFVWDNISSDLNKIEKKKKKRLVWFFIFGFMLLVGLCAIFKFDKNVNEASSFVKIYQNKFENSTNKEVVINKVIKVTPKVYVFENNNNLYIKISLQNQLNNVEETKEIEASNILVEADELFQIKSKFFKMDIIKNIEDFNPLTLSFKNLKNKNKFNIEMNVGKAQIQNIGESNWAAIQLGKNISDRKNISIGIGLKKYNFDNKYIEDTPYEYTYDSVRAINDKREIFIFYKYDTLINSKVQKLNSNILHVFVPVTFRYNLMQVKNFNLDLTSEAVFGYQLSKFKTLNTTTGSKTKSSNYYEYFQFRNKFNLTTNIGIRANYNITKRQQIYIYPSIGKNISSIKNQKTNELIRTNNLNLQFGYNFQF